VNALEQLNLLCRAGFEKECAGEIMALATQHQHPAYIQTRDNSGVVHLISSSNREPLYSLYEKIDFGTLIFTRQWFLSMKQQIELPESDRLIPIMQHVDGLLRDTEITHISDIEFDYADTNEGKSLNKFCRQFRPHLLKAMKKAGLLQTRANGQPGWRLHLLFRDSQTVTIGLATIHNSSPVPMGIPRLKMPSQAPSRSTLKLDEAILWFLSHTQQNRLFSGNTTAVDLGAAPGGWSWQLVQRGCRVTAIDNGPMQDELMASGKVEHLKTDAFTYQPPAPVDWLVCDMAERPLHVSRLIARWFTSGYCHNAIFNLKLPMKKRYLCVEESLQMIREQLLAAGIDADIRAKQLYHDREEITVCILSL
jgi:23S rRNA (cytidine2498-2'-O)-methyltransferase